MKHCDFIDSIKDVMYKLGYSKGFELLEKDIKNNRVCKSFFEFQSRYISNDVLIKNILNDINNNDNILKFMIDLVNLYINMSDILDIDKSINKYQTKFYKIMEDAIKEGFIEGIKECYLN